MFFRTKCIALYTHSMCSCTTCWWNSSKRSDCVHCHLLLSTSLRNTVRQGWHTWVQGRARQVGYVANRTFHLGDRNFSAPASCHCKRWGFSVDRASDGFKRSLKSRWLSDIFFFSNVKMLGTNSYFLKNLVVAKQNMHTGLIQSRGPLFAAPALRPTHWQLLKFLIGPGLKKCNTKTNKHTPSKAFIMEVSNTEK